jgi:cyclic pyranopterin monophosphate synthase
MLGSAQILTDINIKQIDVLAAMKKLSHVNDAGHVQMVDVTGKAHTVRRALAGGQISMKSTTLALLEEGQMSKGNVLTTAKIAAILAAKKTGELIPLCHPLGLTGIDIEFTIDRKQSRVLLKAEVQTVGQTGVEMEALTAVSIAALTIYDMCKAVDKEMIISDILLLEKSGGKSGTFVRSSSPSNGAKS